jgi:hypothetical protein
MPRGKCWPLAGHDKEAALASRFHQRVDRQASDRCDRRGALIAPKPAHRAAVTLLRAIEGFQGQPNTSRRCGSCHTSSSALASYVSQNGKTSIWNGRSGPFRRTRRRCGEPMLSPCAPLSRQALAIFASIEHGADYSSDLTSYTHPGSDLKGIPSPRASPDARSGPSQALLPTNRAAQTCPGALHHGPHRAAGGGAAIRSRSCRTPRRGPRSAPHHTCGCGIGATSPAAAP